MQLMFANHLKVLYSKDIVLNVQAKGIGLRYQVSVKKLNAIESLKTCRKGLVVDKTIGIVVLIGGLQRINCLLAVGQPALRRQELYTGFYSERERLPC